MDPMSCERQKSALIKKGLNIFRDMVAEQLPEQGPAERIFVAFDYPGTEYEAFLAVEDDSLNLSGHGRRVRILMRPGSSSRVMSSYIWKGTKRELLQWLDQEERQGELEKLFQNLADGLAKKDWA